MGLLRARYSFSDVFFRLPPPLFFTGCGPTDFLNCPRSLSLLPLPFLPTPLFCLFSFSLCPRRHSVATPLSGCPSWPPPLLRRRAPPRRSPGNPIVVIVFISTPPSKRHPGGQPEIVIKRKAFVNIINNETRKLGIQQIVQEHLREFFELVRESQSALVVLRGGCTERQQQENATKTLCDNFPPDRRRGSYRAD